MLRILVRKGRFTRLQLAEICARAAMGLGGAYAGQKIDIQENTPAFLKMTKTYMHKYVVWESGIPDDANSRPIAVAFFA